MSLLRDTARGLAAGVRGEGRRLRRGTRALRLRHAGWALAAAALAAGALAMVAGASSIGGAPRPSCDPMSPGDHMVAVVRGRPAVLVHVPKDPVRDLPLVVALPGLGSTGRDFARETSYTTLADRDDFLVAYPTASGTRPEWNVSGHQKGKGDDVAYLRTVIRTVAADTCADRDRVVMTGVSNGAGMTARMACDAADLLAAAAPVAGGYSRVQDCRPSRPLPLLEIHGTGDTVVPYAGTPPDRAGAVTSYLLQWRRLDRCEGTAVRLSPRKGVDEIQWRRCADGTAIEHLRLNGAAHGWPGAFRRPAVSPLSATWRTWTFLRAYRRAAPGKNVRLRSRATAAT